MNRPKIENFKPKYTKGLAEIASVAKQYVRAQDEYIDYLEQQVKNCSIQSVSDSFIAEAEKKCNEYIHGYNTICRPDENFEKYYEKGWIEAINWVVRNYR